MYGKTMNTVMVALCGMMLCTSVEALQPGKKETPEQKAARKARMYRKLGGHVINMATMKGSFVFVNAQKKVAAEPLADTAKSMADFFMSDFRLVESKSSVTFANAAEAIKRTGAIYGVVIVDIPTLPALITVPDGKWALVNVAAIDGDDARLVRRAKLEMWRALGYLCASNFDGCMMQPVQSMEQLDALPDALSQEALYRIPRHLEKCGITPYTRATYKRACEEGWAHQPTNDVEKAIWEKVHTPPTKPLKITYDKDKQKPVVK